MATLFDRDTAEAGERRSGTSIAVGTVANNLDVPMQGKVLVRVPAIDQELWARLAAPGAGSGAGLFYVPRVDDEVLVAFADGDPTDAFVIGGLWNDQDSIPVDDAVNAQSTRILRSGLSSGTGHEVVMDDLLQSVTITTSTDQQITLEPMKIELKAGSTTVTLDNTTQAVSIKAGASITLEASQITLKGATVEINGTGTTTVKSGGVCNVTGSLVKIN
jgi:uncharacterized protein involved in type VI secretion and phage assembly